MRGVVVGGGLVVVGGVEPRWQTGATGWCATSGARQLRWDAEIQTLHHNIQPYLWSSHQTRYPCRASRPQSSLLNINSKPT